ncbi:hypothetical protein FE257_008565 [Aspergillus nanangensis]|uniref:Fatty acyl-CoA reductase n=1 Tax=Aspergillus nanangensis TaxID=2582783 RepID=A0AAD4CLI6_ASPNN|nr:hypothetical protein FE257_008565 [Aspergillus nanangensis]
MWDWYRDKNIFLTGGSGFVGTALVYRLVTEVPVGHIYILCRGGESKLRKKWSEWIPDNVVNFMSQPSLVTVVDGDILKADLGLTSNMQHVLASVVDITIHAASSINLHSPLSKVADTVIEASLRTATMTCRWSRMSCFVYVSTAYSNSHLYALSDGQADVEVEETVYPLDNGQDATEHELEEVRQRGSSTTYENHEFPWPYAYAKHLTERLLQRVIGAADRRLLVIRPSIIGPAQSFPYPGFCLPLSSPVISVTAGVCLATSQNVRIGTQFSEPLRQTSTDLVPVDVVVDRLLVHIAAGSEGAVHAVAGRVGKMPFLRWWNMVIIGMSFNFQDARTEAAWDALDQQDREQLQLFSRTIDPDYVFEIGHRQLWYCIDKFTSKRRLHRHSAHMLYGSWSRCALQEFSVDMNSVCVDDNDHHDTDYSQRITKI